MVSKVKSKMYWLPLTIYAFFVLLKTEASFSNLRPGYVLKFTREPRDTIKASGDNVSLACTAVSLTGHVTYTWLFNNTQLSPQSLQRGGNLTLRNVSKSNEGEYRCVANNSYGSILSLKAMLRIAYLHIVKPSSTSVSVRPMESAKLPAPKVNSFPDVRFSWKRKKGNKLEPIREGTNARKFVSLSGDLFIVGADTSNDAGTYVLVVSNSKTRFNETVEYNLKVSGQPPADYKLSILQPPKYTAATEGADKQVILECIVSNAVFRNRPYNTLVQWYTNASIAAISKDDDKYGFATSHGGHEIPQKLIIFDPEPADEELCYTCVGTGPNETAVTAPCVSLSVRKAPVLPSLISTPPRNISKLAGTTIEIPCAASFGHVVWYQNARRVTKQDFPRMNVTKNGSLLIRNATLSDSALYQAFVRNEVGEISSPPVNLRILEVVSPTTTETKTGHPSSPSYSYTSGETALLPVTSTSQTPTSGAKRDESLPLWFYAVTSAGGVTVLLLISCITYLCVKRRRKRSGKKQKDILEMKQIIRGSSGKVRKSDADNFNCGSRADLLSNGYDYVLSESTVSLTHEIHYGRSPALNIDRPFGFERPQRKASETDSSVKESEYLELLGHHEGNLQIPNNIYVEASDIRVVRFPSSENELALSTFGPTAKTAGANADYRRRSRSLDDFFLCGNTESTHPPESAEQGILPDMRPDEPLYYVLEGPADTNAPERNLYQSLLRLRGQQEPSAGGSDYAKLDIKSRSSSAPFAAEASLETNSGKERRSATTSAILVLEDRCPLHVNEGDVPRFLSLDWRPSARRDLVESKRPISQPCASSRPGFQTQPLELHPNPKPSTSLERTSTQQNSLPERPNLREIPSGLRPTSKLSASLGRPSFLTGSLGQPTGSQPDIFSQPSPLTHQRTQHEPTYVPVAFKATKPRALKHRRNLSDSCFNTNSLGTHLQNSGDNWRCPVEFNETNNKVVTPASLSWPSNNGNLELSEDDTHCHVHVGNSESSYTPLFKDTNISNSEENYAELHDCRSEK